MKEEELIIVTGATGGLGQCIAHFFAQEAVAHPQWHPVFCCRNAQKGDALCQQIVAGGLPRTRFTLLLADMSSQTGVDALAAAIVHLGRPVRWLVNNAASIFAGYAVNADGIERTMALNYRAPARLSKLLAAHFLPGASLVNILSVSRSFFPLRSDDLHGSAKAYFRIRSYSCSKLALTIFTAEMAHRHPQIYVNGVDPGIMNTAMLRMDKWFDPLTDLLFRPFTRRPEESMPAVVAACLNADKVSGHIFTNKRHFPIEKKIAGHPLRESIYEM